MLTLLSGTPASVLMCSFLQVRNVQSDALFILLVEKDAAFMRLAEDRFYQTYPCIILTAKGQPDVASRCSFPILHARVRLLQTF